MDLNISCWHLFFRSCKPDHRLPLPTARLGAPVSRPLASLVSSSQWGWGWGGTIWRRSGSRERPGQHPPTDKLTEPEQESYSRSSWKNLTHSYMHTYTHTAAYILWGTRIQWHTHTHSRTHNNTPLKVNVMPANSVCMLVFWREINKVFKYVVSHSFWRFHWCLSYKT